MTEPLDRRLLDAARRYRAPDDVPRDEMWERIVRARTPRLRHQLWRRAAAALALLAVGAATGVLGDRLLRRADSARDAASASVAVSPELKTFLRSSDSLIAGFRLAATHAPVAGDNALARRARELVALLRTLEIGVASTDSSLHRLLVDIDLVLIQIAQYASSSGAHALELRLIDDAIEARQLAPQLRTVLNAPTVSGS